MKSKINNGLITFYGCDFLFETKYVCLSQNAPQPAPGPFAAGIESVDQAERQRGVQNRQETARTDVSRQTLSRTQTVESQQEREQKEAAMNCLIKLAKGEKPDATHMQQLKEFMLNIRGHEPVEAQKLQPINGSLVKCVIARSQNHDSQYFKIVLYAFNDSQGYTPNVFGRGKTEQTLYFDTKGEPVPANKIEREIQPPPQFNDGAMNNMKYREVFRDDAEGKFRSVMAKLERGDKNEFMDNKNKQELKNFIASLNLTEGRTVNIGGLNILSRRPENNQTPNIIIFKNGRALCYMLNNDLHLTSKDKKDFTQRSAETLSACRTLDQVVKGLKWNRDRNRFTISPNEFNNLQQAFINLARFTSDEFQRDVRNPRTPSLTFNLAESGAHVSYWRLGPSDGFFSINIQGTVFGLNTMQPYTLYTRNPSGEQRWTGHHPSSFNLTGEQRDAEKSSAEQESQQRAEGVRLRQEQEGQRLQEATAAVRGEVANEEKEAVKSNLFQQDTLQHLQPTQGKDTEFTINFQGRNQREKSDAERRTKIQDIFNLQGLNQVLTVTIVNSKGVQQQGMYYPGQETVYKMRGDRQTTERMRILNKDRVIFNLADATEMDKTNKNNLGRTDTIDKINMQRHLAERNRALTQFKTAKGTMQDLDQAKLNEIKTKFSDFDINSILTENRSLTLPDNNQKEIFINEKKILQEGIIKIRAKAKAAQAPAKQPPQKTA